MSPFYLGNVTMEILHFSARNFADRRRACVLILPLCQKSGILIGHAQEFFLVAISISFPEPVVALSSGTGNATLWENPDLCDLQTTTATPAKTLTALKYDKLAKNSI